MLFNKTRTYISFRLEGEHCFTARGTVFDNSVLPVAHRDLGNNIHFFFASLSAPLARHYHMAHWLRGVLEILPGYNTVTNVMNRYQSILSVRQRACYGSVVLLNRCGNDDDVFLDSTYSFGNLHHRKSKELKLNEQLHKLLASSITIICILEENIGKPSERLVTTRNTVFNQI